MELSSFLRTRIQPRVQADGGWLDYASEDGDRLFLTARGECALCPCLSSCVSWVEQEIHAELHRNVRVEVKKAPFLWRA